MTTQIIDLRYLASTKQQPGYPERVAFGHDGKEWKYIFPESVLQSYFTGLGDATVSAATLYGVLGVNERATQEQIQKAYRTKARTWHADTNDLYGADSANSQFRRVQEAYNVLKNPDTRAKYNAGLELERRANRAQLDKSPKYFSPQKCGLVMAETKPGPEGKTIITEIVDWQPIYNEKGKQLSVKWDTGARTFTEVWG